MLIVCPNCQTSYDVSASSLGAEGRSVRCVRCKEVWFATPVQEEADQHAASAAETAGAVSAASASAQYRRGAGAGAAEPDPGAGTGSEWSEGDVADGDDSSIDANLAARAASRSKVRFEDPPSGGGDRTGMDDDGLAAHVAPPLAPAADDAATTLHDPSADIESFATRRARRAAARPQSKNWRPSLATVTFTLIAINAVLIGWRSDVVRVMPQTASLFAAIGLPVNLRGLAFTDVTTTRETHDGVTVVLVQGTIANVSKQTREVPRIRLAMKNDAGAEVYSWTALPERTVLAPGDAEPFQTQLASPPPEGHAVLVRFFNRHDVAAGGQ
jgi:predicted Zn finger-like uncharacterized protein